MDVVAQERDLDEQRLRTARLAQLADRAAVGLRERLELAVGRVQRLRGDHPRGAREAERGDLRLGAERARDRVDVGGDRLHQIPLRDIPGIGKKTFQRLLEAFGTEMAVIHRASEEELAEVLNYKIAERIIKARTGNLKIEDGGGGHYGKVVG